MLLKDTGICLTVHGAEGFPLFGKCPSQTSRDIIDVTFVDDEAIIITARHASALLSKISVAVQIVDQTFRRYGMIINFSKGKTELTLSLRGNGTVQAKNKLAEHCSPDGIPFFPISVADGE